MNSKKRKKLLTWHNFLMHIEKNLLFISSTCISLTKNSLNSKLDFSIVCYTTYFLSKHYFQLLILWYILARQYEYSTQIRKPQNSFQCSIFFYISSLLSFFFWRKVPAVLFIDLYLFNIHIQKYIVRNCIQLLFGILLRIWEK